MRYALERKFSKNYTFRCSLCMTIITTVRSQVCPSSPAEACSHDSRPQSIQDQLINNSTTIYQQYQRLRGNYMFTRYHSSISYEVLQQTIRDQYEFIANAEAQQTVSGHDSSETCDTGDSDDTSDRFVPNSARIISICKQILCSSPHASNEFLATRYIFRLDPNGLCYDQQWEDINVCDETFQN